MNLLSKHLFPTITIKKQKYKIRDKTEISPKYGEITIPNKGIKIDKMNIKGMK